MTKTCECGCGKTLEQKPDQTLRAFSHQKYFDKQCANRVEQAKRRSLRRAERTVPPWYNTTGRQRDKPTIQPDADDPYIPSGLLVPRQEPPDRIRQGVFQRMTRGMMI
jgi:hypothetical protein